MDVKNNSSRLLDVASGVAIYEYVTVQQSHLVDGEHVTLSVLKLVASKFGNSKLIRSGKSMQFPEVTVSAKLGKGEYIARRFVNYAHTDLGGHAIQGTFTTLNYGTATEFYMVEETSSDGGSGAPITTVPGAE